MEFADAVISNLGKHPSTFPISESKKPEKISLPEITSPHYQQELLGIDVYINNSFGNLVDIIKTLQTIDQRFELQHIATRGIKIWPSKEELISSDDLLRLRYIKKEDIDYSALIDLQKSIYNIGAEIILTHNLISWNGMAGFTKAQGE